MPTGYTHAVQDGKITEFEDFVWVCARGMGALINMRDDRADAPIPERFEPSVEYHDNAIVAAQARLQELDGMSPLAVREAAQQAYAEKVKGDDGYEAKKRGWRERYEAMLTKVQAWEPPTQDHAGFKSFMIDQLRQSIDFDCSGSFYDPPEKLEPADWHRAEVQKAMRDVAYHTAERAKEVERTEGRNRWLAQLRASLAAERETAEEV
jgi:hypothetical protein